MFSHLKFSSYRYWHNNTHREDTDVNTCILLRFFEKIKKRIPFKETSNKLRRSILLEDSFSL